MKVMFATPCYISAVSMNHVTSIFDLTHHAAQFRLDCILRMHSESLITCGRNQMVLKFLSDETLTHPFWINSDIAFTPQSVCRLLLIDRDMTAGVYPIRRMNWPPNGVPAGTTQRQFEDRRTDYAFNPVGHATSASAYVDADGFVEVAEAPCGFMCIKRDVFIEMVARYAELNCAPDGPPKDPQAHLHWLFFDCTVDPEAPRSSADWLKLRGQVSESNRNHISA